MALKSKILFALILLSSCMSIKKAEQKVLNDRAASDRVFNSLALIHPCVNDTIIQTISDTTIQIDTLIDYKRDTFNNTITLTEQGKTIFKTIKVKDTKTAYIEDTRKIGVLTDSVRFYKTSLLISTNDSKTWRLRFWALILILGAIALIKYKL